MSKKLHKCERCDFQAKTLGGLKSHGRAKHGDSSKHTKFDLNISTPEQANELVGHLSVMVATSGWLMLKQIMNGNIAVLEEIILDGKDPDTGVKLSEDEIEGARKTRAIMKEMIEKPEQLIAQFKQQAGMEMPTYDPYAVDVRQFNADSRVGQPRARTLTTE